MVEHVGARLSAARCYPVLPENRMASKKLTELAVAKLRPPAAGRIEVWDASLPAFGLRVTDRGTKSFVLMYRIDGRLRRLTLGRYPAVGLVAAREAAREALRQVDLGRDPADAPPAVGQRRAETLTAVVDQFIERHARKTRSWREVKRVFDADLLPQLGRRPIDAITRRDIIEALDRVVDRGSPYMANRLLAHTRKLFNWCLERGIVETSPVANLKAPGRETARDRTLSAGELAAVWRSWERLGWPFGPLFQLLLLTAQRENEVAAMRWCDVDLERALWTLPRQATKADRLHEVPLSRPALALLASLPRVGEAGYVFPSRNRGDRPVSGFSKAKARCDRLSGVAGWRLHDLRRTAASGMARQGVAPHVIEKVLNHSTGAISGVAAVYNRHGYEPEKRQALDIWAGHLDELLRVERRRNLALNSGRPGVVTPALPKD